MRNLGGKEDKRSEWGKDLGVGGINGVIGGKVPFTRGKRIGKKIMEKGNKEN